MRFLTKNLEHSVFFVNFAVETKEGATSRPVKYDIKPRETAHQEARTGTRKRRDGHHYRVLLTKFINHSNNYHYGTN